MRSLHPTTIEITTENHLTERGDCIIGVGAERGCGQLAEETKTALRHRGARVRVSIIVGDKKFVASARGDPGLQLTHPTDIVIRRSTFLSDRTLAVGADAAAANIPASLVERLKDPNTVGALEIEVS